MYLAYDIIKTLLFTNNIGKIKERRFFHNDNYDTRIFQSG
jgi:hypothetical protein